MRDGFLRQGQRGASILTEQAGLAARRVDLDLKDAGFVEDGLEGAKGAEKGTLRSFFCQERQHNDQPCKEQDKNNILHHADRIAGSNVLRNGLEGAKPHAVSRLKDGQREQYHGQQHSPWKIAPARVELANLCARRDRRHALFDSAEEACIAAPAFSDHQRNGQPEAHHGGNAMAVAVDDDLNDWKKLDSNPITPKTKPGDPFHDKYRSWDPFGWVEGDTYYAFGNSKARRVPVPTLPTKYLPTNPHYLVILTILFRGQEHGKKTSTLVPEATLYNETKAWQIPVRNADEGPAGHELLPEEFARLVSALVGWNLIREEPDPAGGPEKLYSITPDGELALIVYSARMKKRGVAGAPGPT